MIEITVKLTKQVEERAIALGATRMNVYKWRKRGIPPKWQLKLLADSRLLARAEERPSE